MLSLSQRMMLQAAVVTSMQDHAPDRNTVVHQKVPGIATVLHGCQEGDELFQNAVHGIFNASKMQRMVDAKPAKYPVRRLPITPEWVAYINGMIAIDSELVIGMSPERRDKPCLCVTLDDPSPYLLIDGHHRVTRRHLDGLDFVECRVLPLRLLEMVRVTREKLRGEEIAKTAPHWEIKE